MLSIATAWLHETGIKPLELFDRPSQGKCSLRWAPANGHEYVIHFVELSEIEEQRLLWVNAATANEGLSKDILISFHEAGDDKVYSAYVPRFAKITEGDLARQFRMKRSHKLTALYALIHLAMPEYEKYDGKQAYEALIRDTKTKD